MAQTAGSTVTFKRPDGKDASGYLVKAAQANAPGLIVIQEWWGLQDQIKRLCDTFAAAGYTALAPDLYRGTVVPYHDTAAANREMTSLDFLDATDETVAGAVKYLMAAGAPKVAITGFCMGGAVAILAASRVPGLVATIPFYGIPPEAAARPADVRVPLQGHFASKDDWCTPAVVDAFEAGLKAAGKDFEIHRYDASHAFMNEQRQEVHDAPAARLAWERTLGFLKKHLG